MIRIGLFEQFFWRIVALLVMTVVALIIFAHTHRQRALDLARLTDLQQEAAWMARHWGDTPPAMLASAWQRTHESVRLSVLDGRGATIGDSAPDETPFTLIDDHGHGLVARAAIALSDGPGMLILSRPRLPVYAPEDTGEFLFWLFAIVVLSLVSFYPLVRRMRRTFDRLGKLARRVADGESGATMKPEGQRELAALIGTFNEMSQKLAREELRKRRLLTDVSHELRSPLGRLRALGETIARYPAEAPTHVAQIDAEIALLDRLVGDMLDSARAEDGGIVLERERVVLDRWSTETFVRLRHRVEQSGATCALTIATPPLDVAIDPQRLLQVLGNVVDNALHATAGRDDARIALDLTVDKDVWRIMVTDNGSGIPEDDLPFVFDRFFRIERHRGRTTGGAGLGLSIARAIVEAHGGRITLDSAVDRGTRVLIEMPVETSSTS